MVLLDRAPPFESPSPIEGPTLVAGSAAVGGWGPSMARAIPSEGAQKTPLAAHGSARYNEKASRPSQAGLSRLWPGSTSLAVRIPAFSIELVEPIAKDMSRTFVGLN